MKFIKKACKSYHEAGSLTRFSAKTTILICLTLFLLIIYLYYAHKHPDYYNRLILCDSLFTTMKAVGGTGIICTIIAGVVESKA